MSATYDKSQKFAFVYSNLYSIYRKGLERAREGGTQAAGEGAPSLAAEALTQLATGRGLDSGAVIKARDLRQEPSRAPAAPAAPTRSYTPAELIGKRVARPASLPPRSATPAASPAPADSVQSLKDNLKSLNDLQARLRFMLQELEDLIKE